MNSRTLKIIIPASIGQVESSLDLPIELLSNPEYKIRGLALVAHPNPLMGGTKDNKVVQTLARALNQLGYISLRPNFRGIGETTGTHDDGLGESSDIYEVVEWMRNPDSWASHEELRGYPWLKTVRDLPLVLAGFSFGTYVSSLVCKRLLDEGQDVERLVLVGSATSKWTLPKVPANTILIHGERDETILLKSVFDWAAPQELAVSVIPEADHFFHRKLHCIRDIVIRSWEGQPRVR